MKIPHTIIFHIFFVTIAYTQEKDIDFSREGTLVFKELGMQFSHIIDFDLLSEDRINVLYESDTKKNLIRLHKNGKKDIRFTISEKNLNNENTIPVGINSRADGSILVLSNLWNGHSWMISVNQFYEDGTIDQKFGSRGVYKKNILDNLDDNYGQSIYESSRDEIIVVAKIEDERPSMEKEKIAILKLSGMGETLSSKLFDDHYFTLNCSAMENDNLSLAYSESIDDGLEQATYLVGLDSHRMKPNNLSCLIIDEGYQSFDQIEISNGELYASRMESDSEGLYNIIKYDSEGSLDTSFFDAGEMGYTVDIYNTSFVVNTKGEIYIISTSLDNDFEILIKKLQSNGSIDTSFGKNGVASVFLKYPIDDIDKIQINEKDKLYLSGSMRIEGSSYGFISKLNLNIQYLKKEKLDKFLNTLFKKE